MKKLIHKILKESDDLDWIRSVETKNRELLFYFNPPLDVQKNHRKAMEILKTYFPGLVWAGGQDLEEYGYQYRYCYFYLIDDNNDLRWYSDDLKDEYNVKESTKVMESKLNIGYTYYDGYNFFGFEKE
jgi:hypothetical protein